MNPAIDTRDLVKTYKTAYPRGAPAVKALDGLTFSVETGTIFGLLGPNGAGKSTTMKILTTLARPDSGQAKVAGLDVLAQPDAVRRVIGYVAQRSGVDPESTGRENLTLQGQLHGMRGAELAKRVDELLDRFQLRDAAQRPARGYSGGMQRKLDVALGLIHRPRVLFLDEPTTGFDPEARSTLWNLISELAESGLTILLTTHYLGEADRLAERIAIVDRGRVVAEGEPSDLKGQLKGDSIQILFAEIQDAPRVREALANVQGIRDLLVDDKVLRARADHAATSVAPILGALDAAGLKVLSVQLAHPSLDDVYLHHTGRSFAQAEAQGAPK
jgi:ABC-2 type transport system ATP-binding protein